VPIAVSPLTRHKELNTITRQVSCGDWANWERYAELIHFEVCRPASLGRNCATQLIFPTTAIFSFSSESPTGGLAESSLAGNEGLVGLWMLTPKPRSATSFTLQTAGFGIVVSAEFLNEEIARSSEFRSAILNYANAMVRYATQTCYCYRYHSIEQQVIKAILLTIRRTGRFEIDMTHQTLGAILGIRREAVTTALRRLCEVNLVEQRRGHIIVLRMQELEAQACECYDAICGFLGYSPYIDSLGQVP